MKKLLWLLLIAVFILPASDAIAKRKHVRIYKPSPRGDAPPPIDVKPPSIDIKPGDVGVVGFVGFDIARRTSCDLRVARGTGPGDPGFDPAGPTTGNFLVPAIYRSECKGVRPKWYGW